MTLPTRRQWLTTAISLAATPATLAVAAQSGAYPARPVTIVVGYPAGGDTDVLARMFAQTLSVRLGQPVLVDNRTGAAGMIAAAWAAKAPADGYTLTLVPNTFVITPHVMQAGKGTQYDPVADFAPIINVGGVSLFMVVNAATGVTSVKDLVAAVKAKKITSYASPGVGSPMHILAELFDQAAGTRITQIPYRGSAPAVVDLLSGQVPLMYSTLGPVWQHITAGKLRPLAVADPKRSPFMPDVPTFGEEGYEVEVGAWQGILGPEGMPAHLVKLLNAHCNEILKMPDVIAQMARLAMVPAGGTPTGFGQLVASEYARYGKIVREFNIKVE
jgi:tripartite-type tricarboxylate transporter receptor subunit TctC